MSMECVIVFTVLSAIMFMLAKLRVPGFEPIPHTDTLGAVFAGVALVSFRDLLHNQ
jgi:hypothetical protein